MSRSILRPKSICLFGLSADPPTGYGGHVGIVQALQQMNEWDEVWVLPVYRHTFSGKRQRLVSYEHRLNMCRLAFSQLNEVSPLVTTKVVISEAEFSSWKTSVQGITNEDDKMKVSVGTAALLDYLHATFDYEFYFCLGGDSFIDLVQGKWQQHDRILNDLLLSKENEEHTTQRRLLVLYRATTTTTANNETEHEKQPLLIQQYAHELGVRLIHIHHLGNISSTQIRNCQNVQELQSSNQMILPQVLEYIQQHRLYSFSYS